MVCTAIWRRFQPKAPLASNRAMPARRPHPTPQGPIGDHLFSQPYNRECDQAASFGQPRFPKPLNCLLRLQLTAPGDISRDCKSGIELQHARRCLTRLRIASEMRESGRETAVSRRKGGVLTKTFLPCDEGFVKATELNVGI